jgi:hypothetical protein
MIVVMGISNESTPRLTTHSTGARIVLLSCARLGFIVGSSRPVNSGVRFLLNALTQESESVNLSFTEAADFLNAYAG